MPRQRSIEDFSSDELRRLLEDKRRADRKARLESFRKTGRIVHPEMDVPEPAPLVQDVIEETDEVPLNRRQKSQLRRKKGMEQFLFAIEITAIVGLFFIIVGFIFQWRGLNRQFASALEQPQLTPTALITAVVLPGGHTAPVEGSEARPNEAEIPEHLRPLMQSYAEMPIPTPGTKQARQIQIPAIGISAPVVLGDGWEQLKKGVGQHVGTANPGETGNMVLSAHNDIFGELFKDLDQLKPGDTIVLTTNDRTFTYVVTGTQIVEPTRVDLMAPTPEVTLTLVSCYPYRIDTQRIVVTAILQED